MFTTEQIIGDIVFISFKDIDRYAELGIKDSGNFMVLPWHMEEF